MHCAKYFVADFVRNVEFDSYRACIDADSVTRQLMALLAFVAGSMTSSCWNKPMINEYDLWPAVIGSNLKSAAATATIAPIFAV